MQGPVGAVVPSPPDGEKEDGEKEEYISDILYYNDGGIYSQPNSIDGEKQCQGAQLYQETENHDQHSLRCY